MKKYQRVAALIDLDAIEENFEAMRAGLPAGTKNGGGGEGERLRPRGGAHRPAVRVEGCCLGVRGGDD